MVIIHYEREVLDFHHLHHHRDSYNYYDDGDNENLNACQKNCHLSDPPKDYLKWLLYIMEEKYYIFNIVFIIIVISIITISREIMKI